MNNQQFHQFSGTDGYVASRALQDVVNVLWPLNGRSCSKGNRAPGKRSFPIT